MTETVATKTVQPIDRAFPAEKAKAGQLEEVRVCARKTN
jgi:hypothetical protein